jgi:hypothetical protein
MRSFLESHTVVTLAVRDAAGSPHAAAVYYAADGLDLYCVSDPRTVHGAAMARGEPIAATIQGQTADWKDIRGLQLHLRVQPAAGPEADRAASLFIRRFPTAARLLDNPSPSMAFWRLRPTWIRMVDNSQGFGHKDEVRFDNHGRPLAD